MDIMSMLQKQKEVLENMGHRVAFIALYGSQNYGLDINTGEYKSDVDMKAVIVPTLDDLITNSKPISEVIDTEWGGQCDLKDIRSFFEVLIKANPAYIETLFTKYYVIDDAFKEEMEEVISLRNELVHALRAQFLRAMYGMMLEKEKALCHPYPSIAHKIERDGYDGKQISHTQRLLLIMQGYFIEDKSLEQCLFPESHEIKFLIDLKLNKYSLEEVKIFIVDIMKKGKELRDSILSKIDESKIDCSVKEKFTKISQQIIKSKIEKEIVGWND